MVPVLSGVEFNSKAFEALLKKHGIEKIIAYTSYHCAHVERYQKTLQRKIFSYTQSVGNLRFRDQLAAIVASYNNTHHGSFNLRYTPLQAEKREFHYAIRWENAKTYSKFIERPGKPRRPKFKLHDLVRPAVDKHLMFRSYGQTFSNKLYTISAIKTNLPIITYKIRPVSKNDDAAEVKGSWYAQELQKVSDSDYYAIEKVIETYPKSKTCKVRWLGYGPEYDSIIRLSELKSMSQVLDESKADS